MLNQNNVFLSIIIGFLLWMVQIQASAEISMPDAPNLQGTWKGTINEINYEHKYTKGNVQLDIQGQKGVLFWGKCHWQLKSLPGYIVDKCHYKGEEKIIGILDPTRKMIFMVETRDTGFFRAHLTSDHKIEMSYLEPGARAAVSYIVLKKSKK